MDTQIHHNAFRIAKGKLGMVKELFSKLGMTVSYEPFDDEWALFKQEGNDVRIQVIEVSKEAKYFEGKEESHIGFISKNPVSDIAEIEKFAKENELVFVKGSWSDQEHWFDMSELFVDFVIEIMDKKILD